MTESSLRFGAPLEGAAHATDAQFIASVRWRNSQPGISAELVSDGDLKAVGLCWKHQCLERRLTNDLRIGFASLDVTETELAAIAGSLRSEPGIAKPRRKSLGAKKPIARQNKQLLSWLDDHAVLLETDPDSLLAGCEILALHSDRLPGTTVGRLWRAALSGAIAQADAFEEAAGVDDWSTLQPGADTRSRIICAGLLPWVCGLLFDEVKGAPRLARGGRRVVNRQLRDLTDGPGRPHSLLVQELPRFLAPWIDALLAAEIFERSLWKDSNDGRFERALQCLVPLLDGEGRLTRSEEVSPLRLIDRAQQLVAASPKSASAKLVQSLEENLQTRRARKQPKTTSVKRKQVPKKDIPSWQSDEGDSACLRTTWQPDASILSLAHHSSPSELTLAIDGQPLLSGPWDISLAEDNEELDFDYEDGWECVCWFSDRDIDYCEIQLEFEGGPKICRHAMLHRTEQYAILSDVVTEAETDTLDWSLRLPVCDGVTVSEVSGLRELRLKGNSRTARVFPLILPQDAGLGTAGRVEIGSSTISVRHPTDTGSLFAPVVIDWNPKRRSKRAEWRKLTVTEAGNVDPDGAAAYRFALGDHQLVLFRTLRPTDRYRTVLGSFIQAETVIANFTSDGEFEELVTVE